MIDKHDIAECIFQLQKPAAFDLSQQFESSGRFVIIDIFQIAGVGIIIEEVTSAGSMIDKESIVNSLTREFGHVTTEEREKRFKHKAIFILITGSDSHR